TSTLSFAPDSAQISLLTAPEPIPRWVRRFSWLRWNTGRLQHLRDRRLGGWAAEAIRRLHPSLCYAFTQVGLETLRLKREQGFRSILETPNGHIRNYRSVYEIEKQRWSSGRYWGHPSSAMVARVEEEYRLADQIRVSSVWARDSLISHGVAASKLVVLQQAV